ncbi:MAG: ATP-binding protein, partial [Pseudohongiellaceae bacterium]
AQPVSAQPAYLFNGAQLDRFGINRRLLPPGSLIVNDPANLWRDYDQWIIAGVVIFALQMLLIALLLEAIRRRRVAEAELQRTQKLDALGSLAGGIAHDFNNTLMSIVANTELAMEDHSEDTALKKQLGNVLAASQRARNMVRQILLFSRQSATQSVALLDTSAQLQESVAQIRSSLPLNCRIDLNCASGLAPVYFDSTQLHQVLLNLCVNAEHAMGGAGVIAIQAQNETVNWSRHLFNQKLPPGEYVTISVSDSGSGISAEDLRRVFEPFFSTKAAGKGSGLGLALVYQIMKAHKGFIDLNSQPEHGTRVTLYLKGAADPEAASEPPLRTSRKSRGDNEPILLVDDDIMVLDTTRHILENLGYEVHAFSNSVEALRRFQKDPDYFRLIFSDLSMPEMDGVRLITRARQTRPTIPVILCTGYQESVGANELENCRILLKPVGAVEIAEAVAGALNEAAGPAS